MLRTIKRQRKPRSEKSPTKQWTRIQSHHYLKPPSLISKKGWTILSLTSTRRSSPWPEQLARSLLAKCVKEGHCEAHRIDAHQWSLSQLWLLRQGYEEQGCHEAAQKNPFFYTLHFNPLPVHVCKYSISESGSDNGGQLLDWGLIEFREKIHSMFGPF